MVTVLVLLGACRRAAPPDVPPLPPKAAVAEPKAVPEAKPPPPPQSKTYEDLGLIVALPGDWREDTAPFEAGREARLFHPQGSELPALLVFGLPPRAWDAHKAALIRAGKDPLDETSELMRKRLVPGAAKPASAAQTQIDESWTHDGLLRGKRLRLLARDAKADGGAETSFVDFYVGEAVAGGLYVVSAAAADVKTLDELGLLVEKMTLVGVRDTEPAPVRLRPKDGGTRHAP
jgi:hypothetical protein